MQGNVIYVIIGFLQRNRFPLREGGHVHVRAAAGNQFNGIVHKLHSFGCFGGKPSILVSCLMPYLPGTVHFITKTPCLNIIRLLSAVLLS